MQYIETNDGTNIYVEVEGPQTAPVLMLSNSLGTNLHMWDDGAVISVLCATIGAVTANPGCRRDPIQWSGSAVMSLRSSTRSASPKSIGADCRWAAWSDSGSGATAHNTPAQRSSSTH